MEEIRIVSSHSTRVIGSGHHRNPMRKFRVRIVQVSYFNISHTQRNITNNIIQQKIKTKEKSVIERICY